MDLASIYRQVLALWQGVPYTELSPEDLLACANRRMTIMATNLSLTPNAGFLLGISPVFSFDGADNRVKDLSGIIQDISRPIRVESRAFNSADDWSEQRHASFENWNDVAERGDGDFIAFYGLPPALTIVTPSDASSSEFRIIYQRLTDKVTNASALLELPAVYEPFLVYDIALEAGELIDNQSPEFAAKKANKMVYLNSRRAEAEEQIDRWRKSQKGTSPTTRRAFNDRTGGLGNRKFTVHF